MVCVGRRHPDPGPAPTAAGGSPGLHNGGAGGPGEGQVAGRGGRPQASAQAAGAQQEAQDEEQPLGGPTGDAGQRRPELGADGQRCQPRGARQRRLG